MWSKPCLFLLVGDQVEYFPIDSVLVQTVMNLIYLW